MGFTKINVGAVIGLSSDITKAQNKVDSIQSAFCSTYSRIDGRILARNQIGRRLSIVSSKMSSVESLIGRIKSTVENSAERYQTTDQKISSWSDRQNVGMGSVGGAGATIGAFVAQGFKTIGATLGTVGIGVAGGAFGVTGGGSRSDGGTGISGSGRGVGSGSGRNWGARAKIIGAEATILSEKDTKDQESLFEKILKDDLDIKGAVLSGEKKVTTEFHGINVGASASGDLIGGSVTTKSSASWDLEDKDASIEKSIVAEGHLATGELSGNVGLFGGKVSGTVGSVSATGTVGASLFKDGKLSPALEAELKAKAVVAEGEAEVKFGNDMINTHAGAEGSVLGAEASAKGGIGKITFEDKATGKTKTGYGVQGEVSAEAYLAEGEVSGGFTIFGIDIDVGLSGKAGGAGVEAGGSVTTSGISGKLGAGLGLGVGVELSVDWSDFELPKWEDLKFWEKW